MKHTILVVEDDAAIAKGLVYGLTEEGFEVRHAPCGEDAIAFIRNDTIHLVLLDVRLPDIDGFEVCRRIRGGGYAMPVLMVTARDEEIDRVLGLEIGADDYITKPFSFRELVSRIKAQIRRCYGEYSGGGESIVIGDLCIDLARIEVRKNDKRLDLTPIEFRLLTCLAHRAGSPLSREQLIEAVWGPGLYLEDERTVDVHIRHLREKIEDKPGNPLIIETVRGFGYRCANIKKT